MQKCYIAGHIGKLPVEEFTANFEKAEKEVIALGMTPVSPLKLPHNHDKTWSSYMKEDLKAMLDCQYVYAQNNIRFSPGGMIEIDTAMKVGINVIHQQPEEKFSS